MFLKAWGTSQQVSHSHWWCSATSGTSTSPCTSSLGNPIKEKLDEMVASEVFTPVTEPKKWVSSMFVVVTPKKLRICFDLEQSHLLRAIPDAHSGGSCDPTFTSKEVLMVSGRNVLILSLVTKPRSIQQLGGTDRTGCLFGICSVLEMW